MVFKGFDFQHDARQCKFSRLNYMFSNDVLQLTVLHFLIIISYTVWEIINCAVLLMMLLDLQHNFLSFSVENCTKCFKFPQ